MDRYIIVVSNNAGSPYERMKDLETKINEQAKLGYRIVGSMQDLHMYGSRYQTSIVMEKTGGEEEPSISVDRLDISVRTLNTLLNNDVKTINQLKKMTFNEIHDLKGMGAKGVDEIKEALHEL